MTEDDIRPWGETFVRAGAKAVPYFGDSILMVLDQVIVRRRASALEVMGGIVRRVGGQEKLAARLASPEIESLFMEGLESAMRTGVAAKRRLLALVIANAVLDDAKVDASQLYVMALRDLEAPHIRALARLARTVQELQPQLPSDLTERPPFVEAANERVRKIWNAEPAPIQAALVRTGCVRFPRGWFLSSHEIDQHITDFGFELLNDLERQGSI